MSEREPGLGRFAVGIAVGVALGLLFATEDGTAFRKTVARRLRALRALGAEKAGDLGTLILDASLSQGDQPRLTAGGRGRRRRAQGGEDESGG